MTRTRHGGTLGYVDARTIGARIGDRMELRGLEEIDIAAAARVSQSTVNRWINGISDPRAENIPAIARVLNVTEHWLITGDERSLVEKLVAEMREDGFDDAEILDTLSGLRNTREAAGTSEARAEPREDASPVPLRSAERHSARLRGAQADQKATGRRRPRAPRPPRNPDGDPPS